MGWVKEQGTRARVWGRGVFGSLLVEERVKEKTKGVSDWVAGGKAERECREPCREKEIVRICKSTHLRKGEGGAYTPTTHVAGKFTGPSSHLCLWL